MMWESDCVCGRAKGFGRAVDCEFRCVWESWVCCGGVQVCSDTRIVTVLMNFSGGQRKCKGFAEVMRYRVLDE